MKVTLEWTETLGRNSEGWIGQVWVGHTAGGTPIEMLVADMRITSDDPVDIARFQIEAALHGEAKGNA